VKEARLSLTRVIGMYLSGRTLQQIAVELGCSPPTIMRRLRWAGVARRKRGPVPQ
jgi:DNA-directed RNA polymerase specialized sigma24 family protein